MILRALAVGPMAANCYVVGCDRTKEAAVIDPGGDAMAIFRVITRDGLTVRCIINTHAHVDHIAANSEIKRLTGAELLIHELDAASLKNPVRNLSLLSPLAIRSASADRTLRDGDVVAAGDLKLEVIHTPGHTPGGISLRCGDALFTGDTLFSGSVGRTDFPGGSFEALLRSLRRLLDLGDLNVYPGHGPFTTLAAERSSNPFAADALAAAAPTTGPASGAADETTSGGAGPQPGK